MDIEKNKKYIVIVFALVIITVISLFYFKKRSLPLVQSPQDEIEIVSSEENREKEEKNKENESVTVFVSGQVEEQKVITLPMGSRLNDAIKECGGLKDTADISRVNLALKLQDEGHYIVPAIGENFTDSDMPLISSGDSSNNKININTSDKSRLMQINSVGEKTAEKIIDYREKNGNFKSIEEIKNVSGIGDKKFDAMKDEITVN